MKLGKDDRGLESLPLRLMIVSVVAAMSVVPAAEALETVRDRDFLSRAGATLDRLIWTVEMLALEGPGAVRTMCLDFSSDGGLKFSKLSLGDRPTGPNASAVVLRLSTGLSMIRIAESPQAVMTGYDGNPLEITDERPCLRLEARVVDGVHVITTSAV